MERAIQALKPAADFALIGGSNTAEYVRPVCTLMIEYAETVGLFARFEVHEGIRKRCSADIQCHAVPLFAVRP